MPWILELLEREYYIYHSKSGKNYGGEKHTFKTKNEAIERANSFINEYKQFVRYRKYGSRYS